MSAAPGLPRPRFGIGVRIYVVTVAAVLATALALLLALRLVHERERLRPRGPMQDAARYAASRLATRWYDADGVVAEVEALRSAGFRASVWDGSGRLLAATHPDAPVQAPAAAEWAALRVAGVRELGWDCQEGPCGFAAYVAGAPPGLLVLAPPPGPRELGRVPPELWLLGLVLAGLGLAAVVLGSSVARPLDRIARTARALGSGDLGARTGLARTDEVGAVARAFDDMADRVAALVRAQTELVANVAHELRTPLARIRVALDLADDGDAAVARESLSEIAEDLAELERLVEDVLAAARVELAGADRSGAPPLRRARVDMAEVARAAAARLEGHHAGRRVSLELPAALPPVDGDPVLLRRVLDNLLDNARKYSSPDAPIRLRATAAGAQVVLEVVDRGEGISAEDLGRLFTPFFRADPSRARTTGGVGLGLALSRRIALAHGGRLEAASRPGAGSTFTLTLPASP